MLLSVLAYLPASGQRVVTPVESNDLPIEIQRKNMDAAADTISTDTVEVKKPIHNAPLFGGLMLWADISAPVMNVLGTQYGSYEVSLEADFYHRFFPIIEVGMGMSQYTPEGNNYTYRVPLSPYARVGLNYNFFFNNGSESFIGIGARYGLSYFSYQWDNIMLDDPYWDNQEIVATPLQNAFAHWGEVVLNLRVQIVKRFYMGLTGRYKILIECGSSQYGDPYYIPGFGLKEGGFGFTYTVGYNLPLGVKKQKEIVNL